MPTTYEGTFAPPPGRFVLVAARFNAAVVDNLVAGALDTLKRHGVGDDAVDVVRVAGSFEIPFIAQRLPAAQKLAAVILLGPGAPRPTRHDAYPAREAARVDVPP